MSKKRSKGVTHLWIECPTQLETVYAPIREGRIHCTACGEYFPPFVEDVTETEEQPPLIDSASDENCLSSCHSS